jgi:hypothetical protein
MDLKDLTAAEFLADPGLVIRAVDFPQRGGRIYVRTPSGGDRDDWEREQIEMQERPGGRHQELADFRARFLRRCLCDAKGNLLYKAEDVPALSRMSAAVLDRLYMVARELAALTAKDEAELLGNSAGAPSGASGSDSH